VDHDEFAQKKNVTSDNIPLQGDEEFRTLLDDPDYEKFQKAYQEAKLEDSSELLKRLIVKYPESKRLLAFQQTLDMQLSLKGLSVTQLKNERQQKTRRSLKLSAFTIVSILLVISIFIGSYLFLNQFAQQQSSISTSKIINDYQSQASQLLASGQPQIALEIIEKMRDVNPDYDGLSELEDEANELLSLETKYTVALGLIEAKNNPEALKLMREVEKEHPGLWDVPRRIVFLETAIQVQNLLAEGNGAYGKNDWTEVINAYEQALTLDPKLDDAVMKEQLLNGYLHRIIQLLESDSTSIEDIDKAETYYRKASSMIPQSRAFASERENLQEISSNLLQLKFTQTAKNLLISKDQNLATISDAVSYLSKAVNLDPKNTSLQEEQRNAQLYLIAFQNYSEMNWDPAITNLNLLLGYDKQFADGNAELLLYEAYLMLGRQYTNFSLYQDARQNLEQAEIISFGHKENKLRIFEVQTLLGDVIGRSGDFQNGVSYYQYALNLVNIYSLASSNTVLNGKLATADAQAAQGLYAEALSSYQDVAVEFWKAVPYAEIEIADGSCLAFFADTHHSTTYSILTINDLPETTVLSFGRTLKVPVLD
jgi:tetratricopeptide (TPR) repeat protein